MPLPFSLTASASASAVVDLTTFVATFYRFGWNGRAPAVAAAAAFPSAAAAATTAAAILTELYHLVLDALQGPGRNAAEGKQTK